MAGSDRLQAIHPVTEGRVQRNQFGDEDSDSGFGVVHELTVRQALKQGH